MEIPHTEKSNWSIYKTYEGITVGRYKVLMESIKSLRDNFIVACIDKADSNYSIICKNCMIIC